MKLLSLTILVISVTLILKTGYIDGCEVDSDCTGAKKLCYRVKPTKDVPTNGGSGSSGTRAPPPTISDTNSGTNTNNNNADSNMSNDADSTMSNDADSTMSNDENESVNTNPSGGSSSGTIGPSSGTNSSNGGISMLGSSPAGYCLCKIGYVEYKGECTEFNACSKKDDEDCQKTDKYCLMAGKVSKCFTSEALLDIVDKNQDIILKGIVRERPEKLISSHFQEDLFKQKSEARTDAITNRDRDYDKKVSKILDITEKQNLNDEFSDQYDAAQIAGHQKTENERNKTRMISDSNKKVEYENLDKEEIDLDSLSDKVNNSKDKMNGNENKLGRDAHRPPMDHPKYINQTQSRDSIEKYLEGLYEMMKTKYEKSVSSQPMNNSTHSTMSKSTNVKTRNSRLNRKIANRTPIKDNDKIDDPTHEVNSQKAEEVDVKYGNRSLSSGKNVNNHRKSKIIDNHGLHGNAKTGEKSTNKSPTIDMNEESESEIEKLFDHPIEKSKDKELGIYNNKLVRNDNEDIRNILDQMSEKSEKFDELEKLIRVKRGTTNGKPVGKKQRMIPGRHSQNSRQSQPDPHERNEEFDSELKQVSATLHTKTMEQTDVGSKGPKEGTI